jgi:hypothetical protein
MSRQVSLKAGFILFFILFSAALYLEGIAASMWQGWVLKLLAAAVFGIFGITMCLSLVKEVNRPHRTRTEKAGAASPEAREEWDTIAAMGDSLRGGFFFIDQEFVIQSRYSRSLESILGMTGLNGKKLPDLLAARIKDVEPVFFPFIEYLHILCNRKGMSPETVETLNPIREIVYRTGETWEERILNCKFVPIHRGSGGVFVLGNIRDVTEEYRLREEIHGLKSLIAAMDDAQWAMK